MIEVTMGKASWTFYNRTNKFPSLFACTSTSRPLISIAHDIGQVNDKLQETKCFMA